MGPVGLEVRGRMNQTVLPAFHATLAASSVESSFGRLLFFFLLALCLFLLVLGEIVRDEVVNRNRRGVTVRTRAQTCEVLTVNWKPDVPNADVWKNGTGVCHERRPECPKSICDKRVWGLSRALTGHKVVKLWFTYLS